MSLFEQREVVNCVRLCVASLIELSVRVVQRVDVNVKLTELLPLTRPRRAGASAYDTCTTMLIASRSVLCVLVRL